MASTSNMSSYVNAQIVREQLVGLSDGGELRVTLLHGTEAMLNR